MVKNILPSALEISSKSISQEVITPLGHALMHHKLRLLSKGLLIPDYLISKIESFAMRNDVLISYKNNLEVEDMHHCCPHCLKAHALQEAKKIGLSKEVLSAIEKMFKGNIGHDGYYMDKEELVKI